MKKKNFKADREIRSDESREVPETALPAAFLARMRELLGGEYEAFVRSYGRPRTQGLRLNPLKIMTEETAPACGTDEGSCAEKAGGADRAGSTSGAFWAGENADDLNGTKKRDMAAENAETGTPGITQRLIEMFGLKKIPWARDGYYYDSETRPGRHPYHEAGLYYIQEPSAMAVTELLDPQPGERVLDLCAAPGGKTTQIAARMKNRGLLVSNEIHPARAKILSQNVERFGAANVVVTNEEPARLAVRFPAYFDRILVDAPCSGEGMFRKDETARSEWSPENVKLCAARQAEILEQAARMLVPGGRLVYSTCTFAPEEDEGTIQNFLLRHTDYVVEKMEAYAGFSQGRPDWVDGGTEALKDTFRIWPHLVDGEGHYAAVLRKKEDFVWTEKADAILIHASSTDKKRSVKSGGIERKNKTALSKQSSGGIGEEIWNVWRQFCKETYLDFPAAASEEELRRRMILYGEQLYLLPEGIGSLDGLKVLRPGLHLGTVRKNRFEPSHALALYSSPQNVIRHYDMSGGCRQIAAYFRGETIQVSVSAYAPTDGDAAGGKVAVGRVTADTAAPIASFSNSPQNGWTLMTVDGFSIGWGKRVGMTIKNHYPKGLRREF